MFSSPIRRPILAALAALLVLPLVSAQSSARLDALQSELSLNQKPHQVALAPDGKRVAWAGDEGILVAPVDDLTQSRHLTAAKAGQSCRESDPLWSPDGKALVFLSNCASSHGQAELFWQRAEGGALRQLSALHGNMSSPAFSPDGKRVGFLYIEHASRPAGALAAMNAPVGVIGEEGFDVQRVATVPVSSSEPQPPSFVTPESLYVYEFDWSPNSKELAYVAAEPPGENNWWVARIYVQALGSAPRKLVDAASASALRALQFAVPRWSPDGKSIAFIAGLMSDQGSTGGDLWIAPAGGGEPVNLTPGRNSTPAWIAWTGHDRLVVSELAGGLSRVVRMRIEGNRAFEAKTSFELPATLGDGRMERSLSLSADGAQCAFLASSFEQAPEIFLAQLITTEAGGEAKSAQPRQLSRFNEGAKPAWGKSVSLTWKNGEFEVQGWLLLPRNFDPAKRYPLIVNVHGGPAAAAESHWARGTGLNATTFSALDYFVLQPNPRGSFGQGEAFVQANRQDFGYGDLQDILAGVDTVLARYPVDPKRVGLMGWSYGGFMTMFAGTQTTRFKAAVAGAGIANWQSYYGQNSIDQWMIPYFGASAYDDPAVYRKSSAVEFVRTARTPTLIVAGERDGECPPAQSFEFWHALKAQGVPTRLVVYPGEGHRFADPAHVHDVVERAVEWFDRYLGEPQR